MRQHLGDVSAVKPPRPGDGRLNRTRSTKSAALDGRAFEQVLVGRLAEAGVRCYRRQPWLTDRPTGLARRISAGDKLSF